MLGLMEKARLPLKDFCWIVKKKSEHRDEKYFT
jgi:ribosomal protein L33